MAVIEDLHLYSDGALRPVGWQGLMMPNGALADGPIQTTAREIRLRPALSKLLLRPALSKLFRRMQKHRARLAGSAKKSRLQRLSRALRFLGSWTSTRPPSVLQMSLW